jgi:hypothetical protein
MPKDADRLAEAQARAEAVYRPDPAETTPAYQAAWSRGLPRWPLETRMPDDPDETYPPETATVLRGMAPPRRSLGHEEDVVALVRLRADGGLVVSAPGAPPTRIVAVRSKRAHAAAQRVAELIEEALRARERRQ